MEAVNNLTRARLAAALDPALERWDREPFIWGLNDCALAVADVLQAGLGFDPAVRLRKRYTTARGYLRVLRRDGFASLDECVMAIAAECNWPRIDPCEAQPGDLGILPHPLGRTAALHYRGPFWIARRVGFGSAQRPTSEIELAFRVA